MFGVEVAISGWL